MSNRAIAGVFMMLIGGLWWWGTTTTGENSVPCYVVFLGGCTLLTHNDPPKEKE